ncbi:DUF11 domain-containing protein, partial [Eubacteriales bacterium OttesenSCG-928-N13]|nr:DUF11 domain-containing protein [Eubacteriales bacterium OttesenSCG-928-N13]
MNTKRIQLKRYLAVLLAMLMVMTSMPMATWADEQGDDTPVAQQDAQKQTEVPKKEEKSETKKTEVEKEEKKSDADPTAVITPSPTPSPKPATPSPEPTVVATPTPTSAPTPTPAPTDSVDHDASDDKPTEVLDGEQATTEGTIAPTPDARTHYAAEMEIEDKKVYWSQAFDALLTLKSDASESGVYLWIDLPDGLVLVDEEAEKKDVYKSSLPFFYTEKTKDGAAVRIGMPGKPGMQEITLRMMFATSGQPSKQTKEFVLRLGDVNGNEITKLPSNGTKIKSDVMDELACAVLVPTEENTNQNSKDDIEEKPEQDPEEDLEQDPEEDLEQDPEEDQKQDPEEDQEQDPEEDLEQDPEEDLEQDPEEDLVQDLEEDSEQDPEDGLETDDGLNEDGESLMMAPTMARMAMSFGLLADEGGDYNVTLRQSNNPLDSLTGNMITMNVEISSQLESITPIYAWIDMPAGAVMNTPPANGEEATSNGLKMQFFAGAEGERGRLRIELPAAGDGKTAQVRFSYPNGITPNWDDAVSMSAEAGDADGEPVMVPVEGTSAFRPVVMITNTLDIKMNAAFSWSHIKKSVTDEAFIDADDPSALSGQIVYKIQAESNNRASKGVIWTKEYTVTDTLTIDPNYVPSGALRIEGNKILAGDETLLTLSDGIELEGASFAGGALTFSYTRENENIEDGSYTGEMDDINDTATLNLGALSFQKVDGYTQTKFTFSNQAKLDLKSVTGKDASSASEQVDSSFTLSTTPSYEKLCVPESGTQVMPGDTIEYTVVSTNNNEYISKSITVTDLLPAGLNCFEAYVLWNDDAGSEQLEPSSSMTATKDVLPGKEIELHMLCTVKDGYYGATITNTGSVTVDDVTNNTEPVTHSTPKLGIEKELALSTDNTPDGSMGNKLNSSNNTGWFDVTIDNDNAIDLTNITASDVMPAGMTLDMSRLTGGTLVQGTLSGGDTMMSAVTGPTVTESGDSLYTWLIDTLPVGESVTFRVPVILDEEIVSLMLTEADVPGDPDNGHVHKLTNEAMCSTMDDGPCSTADILYVSDYQVLGLDKDMVGSLGLDTDAGTATQTYTVTIDNAGNSPAIHDLVDTLNAPYVRFMLNSCTREPIAGGTPETVGDLALTLDSDLKATLDDFTVQNGYVYTLTYTVTFNIEDLDALVAQQTDSNILLLRNTAEYGDKDDSVSTTYQPKTGSGRASFGKAALFGDSLAEEDFFGAYIPQNTAIYYHAPAYRYRLLLTNFSDQPYVLSDPKDRSDVLPEGIRIQKNGQDPMISVWTYEFDEITHQIDKDSLQPVLNTLVSVAVSSQDDPYRDVVVVDYLPNDGDTFVVPPLTAYAVDVVVRADEPLLGDTILNEYQGHSHMMNVEQPEYGITKERSRQSIIPYCDDMIAEDNGLITFSVGEIRQTNPAPTMDVPSQALRDVVITDDLGAFAPFVGQGTSGSYHFELVSATLGEGIPDTTEYGTAQIVLYQADDQANAQTIPSNLLTPIRIEPGSVLAWRIPYLPEGFEVDTQNPPSFTLQLIKDTGTTPLIRQTVLRNTINMTFNGTEHTDQAQSDVIVDDTLPTLRIDKTQQVFAGVGDAFSEDAVYRTNLDESSYVLYTVTASNEVKYLPEMPDDLQKEYQLQNVTVSDLLPDHLTWDKGSVKVTKISDNTGVKDWEFDGAFGTGSQGSITVDGATLRYALRTTQKGGTQSFLTFTPPADDRVESGPIPDGLLSFNEKYVMEFKAKFVNPQELIGAKGFAAMEKLLTNVAIASTTSRIVEDEQPVTTEDGVHSVRTTLDLVVKSSPLLMIRKLVTGFVHPTSYNVDIPVYGDETPVAADTEAIAKVDDIVHYAIAIYYQGDEDHPNLPLGNIVDQLPPGMELVGLGRWDGSGSGFDDVLTLPYNIVAENQGNSPDFFTGNVSSIADIPYNTDQRIGELDIEIEAGNYLMPSGGVLVLDLYAKILPNASGLTSFTNDASYSYDSSGTDQPPMAIPTTDEDGNPLRFAQVDEATGTIQGGMDCAKTGDGKVYSSDVTLAVRLAHPDVTKRAVAYTTDNKPTVMPNQPIDGDIDDYAPKILWTIRVSNVKNGELPLADMTNYVVEDTLPIEFSGDVIQLISAKKNGATVVPVPAYTHKVNADGSLSARWSFNATEHALMPDEYIELSFATPWKDMLNQYPGEFSNEASLLLNQPFVDDQTDAVIREVDGQKWLVTKETITIAGDNAAESYETVAATSNKKTTTGDSRTTSLIATGAPGSDAHFSMYIGNKSEADFSGVSIINRLPYVDDVGVRNRVPRGSHYKMDLVPSSIVVWFDDGVNAPYRLPASDYTIQYTENDDVDFSNEDWEGTNDWDDIYDPSMHNAFRVVMDGQFTLHGTMPEERDEQRLVVTFDATIPQSAINGQVAYNNFAYRYHFSGVGGRTESLTPEPGRVGVRVESTDLVITKNVINPGDGDDTRAFIFRLMIGDGTSDYAPYNGDFTVGDEFCYTGDGFMNLRAGKSAVFKNLPLGSLYRVYEWTGDASVNPAPDDPMLVLMGDQESMQFGYVSEGTTQAYYEMSAQNAQGALGVAGAVVQYNNKRLAEYLSIDFKKDWYDVDASTRPHLNHGVFDTIELRVFVHLNDDGDDHTGDVPALDLDGYSASASFTGESDHYAGTIDRLPLTVTIDGTPHEYGDGAGRFSYVVAEYVNGVAGVPGYEVGINRASASAPAGEEPKMWVLERDIHNCLLTKLRIDKQVTHADENTDDAFEFLVSVGTSQNPSMPAPLRNAPYTIVGTLRAGQTKDSTTDADGKFTLYDGQTAEFDNVIYHAAYRITEANDATPSYHTLAAEGTDTLTASMQVEGEILGEDGTIVHFVNQRKGYLKVIKQVYGADPGQTDFNLAIALYEDAAYEKPYGNDAWRTGTGVTWTNNVGTFTLQKHGAVELGALAGTYYRVYEPEVGPYLGTVSEGQFKQKSLEMDAEEIEITNFEQQLLEVTKTVPVATNDEFDFTMQIMVDGTTPYHGQYRIVIQDAGATAIFDLDSTDWLTTDEDGKASFKLQNGQKACIMLPKGATVTVTETAHKDYVTTVDGESGY